MFTASGELTIENIDKGDKYSNLGGSENGAPSFAKDQIDAHTSMRIHRMKQSRQSSMKTNFYKSLQKL